MTNDQSMLIASSALLAAAAVSMSIVLANAEMDGLILLKLIPGLIAAAFGTLMTLNSFDGVRNEERKAADKEAEKAR